MRQFSVRVLMTPKNCTAKNLSNLGMICFMVLLFFETQWDLISWCWNKCHDKHFIKTHNVQQKEGAPSE